MLEQDNQQQQQEEKAKVPTLEEVRQERRKEEEVKQHQHFLGNMEGKTARELNIAQLSYLFREHRQTYDKINQDKSIKVENIEWLDKMAQQKKASTAQFEEQKAKLKEEFEAKASLEGTEKPQPQIKMSEKAMLDMIDKSIEKAMKNFKLF